MFKFVSKTRFIKFAQFASGLGLVTPVVTGLKNTKDLYGRFRKGK